MELEKMTDRELDHAWASGRISSSIYMNGLVKRLESLRAENAVMRELCEASFNQKAHYPECFCAGCERYGRLLKAYRAMEGKG